MTTRTDRQGSGTAQALTDVAAVVAASAAAFACELLLADFLPWGAEARGLLAVLTGAGTAMWLTLGRGGTLADLGLRRPARWSTVPLWALGIFIVFVVAQNALPLLVASQVDMPAPDMSRYDAVRGNLPAAIGLAVVLPLTAAIPEEILYRGFMIGRFTRVFGSGRTGALGAVLAQALLFGLVHFQWGPGGVAAATLMGIVWGGAYLLCGRNLWIVIIAHSMAHIALVVQLYSAPVT